MIQRVRYLVAAVVLLGFGLGVPRAAAQISMSALTSWGDTVNSPGWMPPSFNGYQYLTTGNTQRGLAFANNQVYLVSRAGSGTNIRILDPTSGADLGGLGTSGISGGTFAVDMAATGSDGALYVGNLQTAIGSGAAYKVYQWTTPNQTSGANPTTAVTDTTSLPGARLGDSLAAIGSGSSTQLVAGYNSSPSVTGNNGFAIINPTSGTSTAVSFPGTPPNAGDFKLGISFVDSSHVVGTQTGGTYQYASFSGSSGTLISSVTLPTGGTNQPGTTAERLLSYSPAPVGGMELLAIQSTGDSHVSLYNVNNPAAPVFLTSGLNIPSTVTPVSNGNATGELAWDITGTNSAILYAMSTNQGIQAFNVTFSTTSTSLTWTGTNSGNWSDAGNWNPGNAPPSNLNTQLTFGATTNAAMTNDIGAIMLNSMTFRAGAPAYSLTATSSNSLNFVTNSSGALPQIVTNSSNGVTLSLPVALTTNLSVSGSGSLALNGALSGPGALTMAGTGVLTLGDSSSSNTYTGGTNVQSGILQVAADAALGTGNVTGASPGTLQYTGTTTTARQFSMNNGTIAVSAGQTLTFNGNVVASAFLDGAGTFATAPPTAPSSTTPQRLLRWPSFPITPTTASFTVTIAAPLAWRPGSTRPACLHPRTSTASSTRASAQ